MGEVYTFDLDDTLRYTQEEEYDATRYAFADWLAHNHDIDRQDAIETQADHSSDLYPDMGLSRHRFPQACREAYDELVEEPVDYEREIAWEIGRQAFGDEDYYAQQGLVHGAEDVLDELAEQADTLVLITAGDPIIQERKIAGLALDRWFDETRITDDKAEALDEIARERDVARSDIYHVGNSENSDVQAAQEAGVNAVHILGGSWEKDTATISDGDVAQIRDLAELLQI
ncbi:MAG: HAD family hydrolase [Candidatus Nanohaloarchaea archaeon]|nr:HAD family hydrolase [Candidatus Nanohaloarchaea archaeon]